MAQAHSLRNVSRARTPDQGVLEGVLESAMDPIAHVLNGAVAPHNQCLGEVGIHTLALRVDPDQLEFLPAALHDVLDTEVVLATHDDGLRLTGELVEEVKRDGVDLVVDVEALDVLAVVLHDDVDEVVDGGVFVADEDFGVEDLVVAEDVVEHLVIKILGGCLEGNLHTARRLRLEVNIAKDVSPTLEVTGQTCLRWFSIQSDTNSFQLSLKQRALLSPLGSIQHHENKITRLGC